MAQKMQLCSTDIAAKTIHLSYWIFVQIGTILRNTVYLMKALEIPNIIAKLNVGEIEPPVVQYVAAKGRKLVQIYLICICMHINEQEGSRNTVSPNPSKSFYILVFLF